MSNDNDSGNNAGVAAQGFGNLIEAGAPARPSPTLEQCLLAKEKHLHEQLAKLDRIKAKLLEEDVLAITAQELSFVMYPECY